MEQLTTFALASRDLLIIALLHPAAAGVVGGFVGGYTLGIAQTKTAFVELGRAVVFGAMAAGLIVLIQLVIGGTA